VRGRVLPGKSWEISYADFLRFVAIKECHYCGAELVWPAPYEPGVDRSNLDRKDSDAGYSKDNCVTCCFSCNVTKGTKLTYEEMVLVGNHRRVKPRRVTNTGRAAEDERAARERRKRLAQARIEKRNIRRVLNDA
jgi:hypothetical protein